MEVIEKIKVRKRQEKIKNWYSEVFPIVAAYVHQRGGDLDEAKEVFQEAVVLLYEKQTINPVLLNKSEEAYLVGIAKNRWLKYCIKRQRNEQLSGFNPLDESENNISVEKLTAQLRKTGEKCMDLLQAFYYEKVNMTQLARRFGYKSERSATVQKYKCLEKMRDQVKRNSLSYADFIE